MSDAADLNRDALEAAYQDYRTVTGEHVDEHLEEAIQDAIRAYLAALREAPVAVPVSTAPELLHCPFCQKPLTVRAGVNAYGRCDTPSCWMEARKIALPLDDPEQVRAWNRRASESTVAALRAEVERLTKALEPFHRADLQIRHAHLSGHLHDDDMVYVRVGDVYAASDAFQGTAARALDRSPSVEPGK